jgi:glutathione S-transferase
MPTPEDAGAEGNRTVAIQFYDLAGGDQAVRFSPNCWRIRMALAHKGLAFDDIPLRFVDKEPIAFSGQKLLPVIRDGARAIHDSWDIAVYLEQAYPDRPPLFQSAQAMALCNVMRFWVQEAVHRPIQSLILVDIHDALDQRDKVYFRSTREARLGMTLEQFRVAPAAGLPILKKALSPVREALQSQPFLSGPTAAYADYLLLGAFMWARAISPIKLLERGDPVYAWRERMLDLFDGLARKAPGAGA